MPFKAVSTVLVALLCASTASAAEGDPIPPWSGDVAFVYGRNLGQGLNVAGLALELKRNVHPQVAVGARMVGAVGVQVSGDGAKAYSGSPILLKGEGFLNDHRSRPYAGLGLGGTFYGAAGVVASSSDVAAYAVRGPAFTMMPEIGYDLGGFRIALQHTLLVGSSRGVAASIEANGNTSVDYNYPGMGSTTLQLGGHIGGPRK